MKFGDLKDPFKALLVGGALASVWGCGPKEEPVFSVGAVDVEKMQRNYDSAKKIGVPESELSKRVAFSIPTGATITTLGSIETLEITRPVGEIVGPDGNLPEDMSKDEPWTVQNGGNQVGTAVMISWKSDNQPHEIFAYIPEFPQKNNDKFFAALGRVDLSKVVGRFDDPYTNCRFVADRDVFPDPNDAPAEVCGRLLRIEDVRVDRN